MPNFFKSFFSGKSETSESEKQKNNQKNFEIFKYDGLRAQRMGRPDYAVKCFTEALAIEEDFASARSAPRSASFFPMKVRNPHEHLLNQSHQLPRARH